MKRNEPLARETESSLLSLGGQGRGRQVFEDSSKSLAVADDEVAGLFIPRRLT